MIAITAGNRFPAISHLVYIYILSITREYLVTVRPYGWPQAHPTLVLYMSMTQWFVSNMYNAILHVEWVEKYINGKRNSTQYPT